MNESLIITRTEEVIKSLLSSFNFFGWAGLGLNKTLANLVSIAEYQISYFISRSDNPSAVVENVYSVVEYAKFSRLIFDCSKQTLDNHWILKMEIGLNTIATLNIYYTPEKTKGDWAESFDDLKRSLENV